MERRYRLTVPIALALLRGALYAQLPVPSTPAPNPAATAKPAEEDAFGRESPRGCVLGFLKAAERGEYSRAAQYLDLHIAPEQAEELARDRKSVV